MTLARQLLSFLNTQSESQIANQQENVQEPLIITDVNRKQVQFDLKMIQHLVRDVSISCASLKIRDQTVNDLHKNLLRVTGLNKYIVHQPYVQVKTIGELLRYDCYSMLNEERDFLNLAQYLIMSQGEPVQLAIALSNTSLLSPNKIEES